MTGWAINFVYLLALLCFSPWLLYRRLRHGKYRAGWNQKLWGQLSRNESERPLIWIHAVSVGEALLIEPLVRAIQVESPQAQLLITTTTSTGWEVATQRYPTAQVSYCPWDFTWSVRNALDRARPSLIILVELELWPNLLRLASQRDIPVVLVNGRLSEHSFRGYRWLRPLLSRCLKTLRVLCVQNEEYHSRFVELGADARNVSTTGSLKFDGVRCDRGSSAVAALRSQVPVAPGESLWLAGSTHAPEEEFVLRAYQRLVQQHPTWRLMVVPRHAERFDEVSQLIRRHGFDVWERATGRTLPADSKAVSMQVSDERRAPVLLLNTLGELSTAWGLASLAFVGGSLTSRGGQNMIEPAAYGVPVIVGPNTSNFRQIVEALLSVDALRVVNDEHQLAAIADSMMSDPAAAQRLGDRAREFVLTQQGATQRTLDQIRPWLPATRDPPNPR